MGVIMQKQSVRVIVASEHRQAREFLKEIVEEEGTFLVGQAQDVTKAVTLVSNLRPDVAVIDCNLPYSIGLDTVRLSRMGGLDTAQIISETIPSTRVIIITNLDTEVLLEHRLSMDAMAFFSRQRIGGNIPLRLQELCHETMLPETLAFANVEVKQRVAFQQKFANRSGKTVFYVSLGTLGGLCLAFILVFGGGVFLAFAAGVIMFLSLARKRTVLFWRKIKNWAKRDLQ